MKNNNTTTDDDDDDDGDNNNNSAENFDHTSVHPVCVLCGRNLFLELANKLPH